MARIHISIFAIENGLKIHSDTKRRYIFMKKLIKFVKALTTLVVALIVLAIVL